MPERETNPIRILVVDDDESIRRLVNMVLTEDGCRVWEAPSGEAVVEIGRELQFDLVLCDVKMGDMSGFDVLQAFKEELQADTDVVLMTGYASLESALSAVRAGARDYIVKPFSIDALSALVRSVTEHRRRDADSPSAASELAPEIGLVGRSAAMFEVFKTVGRIAPTDLPVLISGETGTGKEVIARMIHAHSARASRPFVAVNCGALTETLLETELFGHVRGSFTGAQGDRRGLFEEADGGTLLLDEVTETTQAFQVKLLRALQESEIRRVGSNVPVRVNVRVLATTNRDPETLHEAAGFRSDLLYRLNVFSVHLPPLRERGEDIDLMISAFLERFRPKGAPAVRIDPEALASLRAYAWPGNVRELHHTMQRLAVLNSAGVVRTGDLPKKIREGYGDLDAMLRRPDAEAANGSDAPGGAGEDAWLSLAEVERRYLLRVLRHTQGNKKRAAEILNVDRKTLTRMVERHGVDVEQIKVETGAGA